MNDCRGQSHNNTRSRGNPFLQRLPLWGELSAKLTALSAPCGDTSPKERGVAIRFPKPSP